MKRVDRGDLVYHVGVGNAIKMTVLVACICHV